MRACTFTLEMCACYTLGKHMQEIPEIEEKRVPKLYEPQLSLNTKDQKIKQFQYGSAAVSTVSRICTLN